MKIVCGWCTEQITNEQMSTIHIHHDPNTCSFIPPGLLDIDDSGILPTETATAIMEHEMMCTHQLYYHQNCCRVCSSQMAYA